MIKNLRNCTALVTGASRGLGLTVAKRLSQNGCSTILCARNETRLRENLQELATNEGQKHSYLVCDLTNSAEISGKFSKVKDVNILINCAGVMQSSLLMRAQPEEISSIITTNLTAPILISQKISKGMLLSVRKHPELPNVIINVASCLAHKSLKGTSVYSASKAGLIGFTKALAKELAPKGIRVNSVSPGLIMDTDMGSSVTGYNAPLKTNEGLCSKEDIADCILALILSSSITGQNIVIDDGYVL